MAGPLRLYGLKAVVVNAADGIGEAVARTLLKHGATVVAAGDNNSGVEQHFRSVKGIDGLCANLRQPESQSELVREAAEKLGGIDILVCDFPLRPESPIKEAGAELTRLLEQRAALTMAIARATLPYLKKSPAGRIINVGFLRSVFAIEGLKARDAAERDLARVTRAILAEIGEHAITVNYVQPGAIMTPWSREVFGKHRELRDFCIANTAARRLGEPVDVAKVVLFLASDDAMFVNGCGIATDGGRTDL